MENHAEPAAVNHKARHSAARLSRRLHDQLVSVLYYPHALSNGGLVVVSRDEVESLIDLIAEAYQCVPADLPMHCLRRAELFELSLPAFAWLHVLNRQIQLPYWLKQKGVLLYGIDIRDEIPAPPDPRVLLNVHIESCRHFVRNHHFLNLLAHRQYLDLIKKIDWQIKCLMSTALLIHGQWVMSVNSIQPRFASVFHDEEINGLWRDFKGIGNSINWADEAACRRAAYEAVWLFECFLRKLREYAR